MRCAIDFREDISLMEQEVKAWGEMQSLEEEPEYKESEITDEGDKEFFRGYKFCLDTLCNNLESMVMNDYLSEEDSDNIQIIMSGELCMLLFSILDNQVGATDPD